MKSHLIEIYIIISMVLLSVHSGWAQNLDTYQKEAAENNPGLRSRYKAFEAALQKVPQASAWMDPNLSLGYFLSPVETRVGAQQFKVSLSQMFPWFGTLPARAEVEKLKAEALYQDFLNERNQLYYQVAVAYYELQALKELITIEEHNIEKLDSYKNIIQAKYRNARETQVNLIRANLQLDEAQTALEILELKEDPLRVQFNRLLDRPDTIEVEFSNHLSYEQGALVSSDSIAIDHPALQSLDLKLEASQKQQKVIQKQGLPNLGLGVDYVMVAERNDVNTPDNGKDILMPMVSLSLPIFRNKYKAARKESELMAESYEAEKQNIYNRLSAKYSMANFKKNEFIQRIELYDRQIKDYGQSLLLLNRAYGNGEEEFEEVLRMEQKLIQYQQMRVSALKQLKITEAEIKYITNNN